MFDLLIRNGTIVDGTGKRRYLADLAVEDGIIAAIASHIEGEAKRVIDAEGLIVAPGFIDPHTHSDSVLFRGTDAYNRLEQGVTTEFAGMCGGLPAPTYDGGMHQERYTPEQIEKFRTYKGFFEEVEKLPLGVNIGFFAGQSNIRGAVMGYSDAVPNEDEVERMRQYMREAMEEGCFGVSTGLVYVPSVYATTEEIVEIAKVAHAYGGLYTSHIRGEGIHLVESVEEAIDIGRKSGIPVNISHIKVIGMDNKGLSDKVLAIIDRSNAEGIQVTADQYPFTGSAAPLLAQIPPKYQTEGIERTLEKLSDPDMRRTIEHSIWHEVDEFESNIYAAGYDGCLFDECSVTQEYVGKTIGEIAREQGKDPFDTCCEIIVQNHGVLHCIYFNQNDYDLLNYMAHPLVVGGSDTSDFTEHYPEDKIAGDHPRSVGTMTRRLELIRDHGLMSLEESVHRITGKTAEIYKLATRGRLAEGLCADITIFDYKAVKAHCDYIHPYRRNEGIEYVIVGGAVALEHGVANGVLNGKLLKLNEQPAAR